jgi:hypothetical protein
MIGKDIIVKIAKEREFVNITNRRDFALNVMG